jgi:hypothetical protein
MKIINIDHSTKFKLVPREYSASTGTTITLRNEMTDKVETHPIDLTIDDGYYEVDLNLFELLLSYKYSFKIITEDDLVLFEGKIFVINDTVSVQDYKQTITTTTNFTF